MKRRGSIFAVVCWGLVFFMSLTRGIIFGSWDGYLMAALALVNVGLQLYFYFKDRA